MAVGAPLVVGRPWKRAWRQAVVVVGLVEAVHWTTVPVLEQVLEQVLVLLLLLPPSHPPSSMAARPSSTSPC